MGALDSLILPAILLLVFVNVLYRLSRAPLYHFPGHWLSRWTGLVLQVHWIYGNRANELDISDIDAVKEIHRVGGGFLKSPWYQTLTAKGVQNMFNTSDPVFHGRHRRLLSTPISDSSLHRVQPVVESRIQLTIHKMQEELKRDGVIDVHKWWVFMATDTIGELSFGESFKLLENGECQFTADLKAIGSMEWLLTTFPLVVQLASVLPLPFIPNIVYGGRRMVKYADECIERYKKQLCSNPDNPKTTLFTKFYNACSDGLTDTEIRDEALSYIIAGSDTTATTLTYLVWAVCKDPNVKKALLEAIDSLPETFTDREVRQLPYLEQVINETLRLFAGAPSGLLRTVPHQGAKLAGYFVPEGVTVSTQAYTLHRDPEIFPEPERFDPSRWEAPTNKMKDAFMPFGGGARICLGQYLARREVRLAVSHFFRTFPRVQISTRNMSDSDMEQVVYFLMSPRGKHCLVECP